MHVYFSLIFVIKIIRDVTQQKQTYVCMHERYK
jgi:hypothetical protein